MKRQQRGVATIEFAMGFFAFWLICMAWVEMSFISYVSSINDMVISEISRTAKKQRSHYLLTVKQVLERESGLFNNVIEPNRFRFSIQYLGGIEHLTDYTAQCQLTDHYSSRECGMEKHSAIAIYHIDYQFEPIFTYFSNLESLMSREMIVVQEYERSFFPI